MHESAAATSLLEEILRRAEGTPGRICRVSILAPGWDALEAESIRFHWDAVTRGTRAAGCRLDIALQPPAAQCLDCGWAGTLEDADRVLCASCHSEDVLELDHHEPPLVVQEIELVEEEAQ